MSTEAAGWIFMGLGALGYGVAHFFQASAARTTHQLASSSFFRRLASERVYWYGVAAQLTAAVAAVAARRELPLFLVQTALTAGIGITALLGVVRLGWRLPRGEVALLITMAIGLTMLIASAQSSSSRELSTTAILVLATLPCVFALTAAAVSRIGGVAGSVMLGSLAGVGFSAAAVSSRPLANAGSIHELITDPLLYILAANGLVAQVILAQAFRAGSTAATVASLDAAGAAPAAVVGVLLLGDSVRPGFEVVAATGFLLTLSSVVLLARYAKPQAHPQPARQNSQLAKLGI